ncbi:MAG: molybdopterin-binding protein [Paracoccaceae bacterium]|jgi:molybdopterin molybdotransferase
MFDDIVVFNWSTARGSGTDKNTFWVAHCNAQGSHAHCYQSGHAAISALQDLAKASLKNQTRLLIGADFALGAPSGLAAALTGQVDGLALWDWLLRIKAMPPLTGIKIAQTINRALADRRPFWSKGRLGQVLESTAPQAAFAPIRQTAQIQNNLGRASKPFWRVDSLHSSACQSLVGITACAQMRASLGKDCSVWPFELATSAVVLLEVCCDGIAPDLRAAIALGKDGMPTRLSLMAQALWGLAQAGTLENLFVPNVPKDILVEEGWALGSDRSAILRAALPATHLPPRLRNDVFAMPQGVTWIPVDEALARLKAVLTPVTTTHELPTAKAFGRVLAQDCLARRSNPPMPNSAVDGYAFRHQTDLMQGVVRLPLAMGRAAAGQPFVGQVPAGYALRILTGAILPDSIDTVVLEEDCVIDGASVTFDGPVKPHANTRKAGEDVVQGATALPRGHKLRSPDLALLSSLGIAKVTVYRPLRVGILSTGDEIIPRPDLPALPHQIYDANRPMLLALAQNWDFEVVDLGHHLDQPAKIKRALDRAAAKVDVILTSGGASAGDEDHVSRLLAQKGALSSWRIAMKPGRPLALALWNGVPVMGLPGNPVAALVCALVFGRPALSLLAGGAWISPQGFDLPAAFTKTKKAGRREYLRARVNEAGEIEVFASEGSGRISGLSWADGLVELPDGAVDITLGDKVRYCPYSSFDLT